ncbi:MAG: cobalt-zinc-cadmium efflux system outer membrane protein, partial [Pseudohongiellaceae bacterium]
MSASRNSLQHGQHRIDELSGLLRGACRCVTSAAGKALGLAMMAALLLPVGCATDDLAPDYDGARALIASGTGAAKASVYDPNATPLTEQQIADFLADGLTLDETVQLALLNSRRLQAGFMGLGMARADVVQAGLLENPSLGLSLLFPAGGGQSRLGAGLAQSVMEIWRLPERRAVAEAGMEQQVLALANQAALLVADVRVSYYRIVAARQSQALAEGLAELGQSGLRAMDQRVSAGIATAADANDARGEALQWVLDARLARGVVAEEARQLASMLSLKRELLKVPLTTELPLLGSTVPDHETLMAQAQACRLDVRALSAAIDVAESAIALEEGRASPDVAVGLAFENPESDNPTDHVLGPSLRVELPIFDHNEAQISKARFEWRQLRKLWLALDAELTQELRAASDRAALALDVARFVQAELLPQAERSQSLAREARELGDSTEWQ